MPVKPQRGRRGAPADGGPGQAEVSTLALGAWEGDRAELQRAAPTNYGDVDDLPPALRFQVYVTRMIRTRERQPDAETAGAAAFILVSKEQQRELTVGRTLDRNAHTGRVRLAGRLHFVTQRAMSSVFEECDGNDNALFSRIELLDCAHLPALVYLPSENASAVTYYPNGTGTDDGAVQLQLDIGPVAEADILSVVNAVYETELCTPDNAGPVKLWENANKGFPVEEAERTVQQFLRIGLAGRFSWCSIRAEQPGKLGRTDIEVVDDRTGAPGAITHHALLELKVLRSFTHTGSPYPDSNAKDAVSKGVNQAHAYGLTHNSLLRMLCCFDMRTVDVGDDTTFSHVMTDATTLSVRLKRWYMYRSSEHYRDAIAHRQRAAASKANA